MLGNSYACVQIDTVFVTTIATMDTNYEEIFFILHKN
jgi:hypothetical protein